MAMIGYDTHGKQCHDDERNNSMVSKVKGYWLSRIDGVWSFTVYYLCGKERTEIYKGDGGFKAFFRALKNK